MTASYRSSESSSDESPLLAPLSGNAPGVDAGGFEAGVG
jgi:hypothetical protein